MQWAMVTGGVAALNHRLIAVTPPGSKQPEAAAHRELGRNIQELRINVRYPYLTELRVAIRRYG